MKKRCGRGKRRGSMGAIEDLKVRTLAHWASDKVPEGRRPRRLTRSSSLPDRVDFLAFRRFKPARTSALRPRTDVGMGPLRREACLVSPAAGGRESRSQGRANRANPGRTPQMRAEHSSGLRAYPFLPSNSSSIIAFSSFSSLTVRSILARLKSLMGRPWTISSSWPLLWMGKELMSPGSTP